MAETGDELPHPEPTAYGTGGSINCRRKRVGAFVGTSPSCEISEDINVLHQIWAEGRSAKLPSLAKKVDSPIEQFAHAQCRSLV
jgi:hypothetical protein